MDEIEDTQIGECVFVHEANDAPKDILKVDTDRDLFNNGMFENSQNIDILRYMTHAYSLQVTYVIFILCFRLGAQVTHASFVNISIVGRVLAAWETAVPAMSPEKGDVLQEINQNQITELIRNQNWKLYLVQSSIWIARQVTQLVKGSLLLPHVPVQALCQGVKPVGDLVLKARSQVKPF